MVRVTLQPAPGTQGAPIDVDAGDSVTNNVGQIESRLNLDVEAQKVVVVDAAGVAVDFREPTAKKGAPGVDKARYYLVTKVDDTEKDAVQPFRISPEDAIGLKLEQQANLESERTRRAMMAVYQHGYAGCGEALEFPDYNAGFRAAYAAGVDAQVPDSIGAADVEMDAFSLQILRVAFKMGLESKVDPAKGIPSTEDLREAYKRGKEAVYLAIPDQSQWSSVNKDTFKLCSVPVEYAQYMGGASQKLKDQVNYRNLCRQVFHQGVDDAWEARSGVHVSDKTAQNRIPSSPSVADAYTAAQRSVKAMDGAATGCSLKVEEGAGMKLSLVMTPDSAENASVVMFAEGLNAAAAKTAQAPDTRVPDTAAETKDKVKLAYAEKMKRDKEVEKQKREDEREAAAAAAAEAEKKTFFQKCCIEPCGGCYAICCKGACTWNDGEPCMCWGTSCGDWALILFLFAIYYSYLGMWYWAFIEILMTVAEPQRPW